MVAVREAIIVLVLMLLVLLVLLVFVASEHVCGNRTTNSSKSTMSSLVAQERACRPAKEGFS